METPAYFPRQDLPESAKSQDTAEGVLWGKNCIDYAISNYDSYRRRQIEKINHLYNTYNGIIDNKEVAYLNRTYGKANIAKYIDYRLGRPKLDLIRGEFLDGPLNATVYTINKEAKAKKLKSVGVLSAMYHARKKLEQLRDVVGIDVYGGMPLPDKDPMKSEGMNMKNQNEMNMQFILNKQIKSLNLKSKFSENLLDIEIAAECFGKIYLDEDGKLKFRDIDPRDALFEEIDRDPFLKRSPYKGERRIMFRHDILTEFALTQSERDKLDQWGASAGSSKDTQSEGNRNYFYKVEKSLAVEVFTIEWKSLEPYYVKRTPDKRNVNGAPFESIMDASYYEKNKNKVDWEIRKRGAEVETRYKTVLWEATRIGNDIYKNIRKKKYIPGSIEEPFETEMSYQGLLFNTKDGIRISLQETLDNISKLYNMVMFQINRELSKAKGKVIAYDKAYLPKGMTTRDVLYDMTNDGVYYYNSAEDGNISGEKIEVNGAMREVDLGISSTVQVLINLKLELQNTADLLSGMPNYRTGSTPASATATNAQGALRLSRTITGPMFYFFDQYVENIFTLVCELSKISYGLLRKDEGSLIVGEDGVQFLGDTMNIALDDYGVFLADARKESEIRERVRGYMGLAINAGEQRIEDGVEFELAETLPEAVEIVRKGWKTIKDLEMQKQTMTLKANQQEIETKLQISKEDREDRQQHEKELVILAKQLEASNQTLKEKNAYITKMRQSENKQPPS